MATDLSRARWRKSSRSGSGNDCVEVAALPGTVAVRDSKDPDGPALLLASGEWLALLGRAKGAGS